MPNGNPKNKGKGKGWRGTDLERFESKILYAIDGCWYWLGWIKPPDGYGMFRFNGGRITAHRFSYLQFNGPIPDDKIICHKCDHPSCVNPTHLYLGTDAENVRDRDIRGRWGGAIGSKSPFAKLKESDILKIKSLYIPRVYSMLRIANDFGVSERTIYCVIHNLTWKHI